MLLILLGIRPEKTERRLIELFPIDSNKSFMLRKKGILVNILSSILSNSARDVSKALRIF